MKRLICAFLALCCIMTLLPVCFAQRQTAAEENASEAEETAEEETVPTRQGNDKLIALTFDDGPGKDTERLLNGLRARGVHCTFFIVGYCAKARPSVVRQCYEDGHQIASHTYNHPDLRKLSDSEIRSELNKTAEVLTNAIGASNVYMVRPPYGGYNQRVLDALGVPAFYWSDDSGDWWSGATANSVYNNTMKTAGDGDILLLHDSHSWSVDAALRIVDSLKAQGYEFVTLSELFRRRGVELKAGKIYSWLRANGTNLPAISVPSAKLVGYVGGITELYMSSDPGTKIYYTTDGSVPNANSAVYSKPMRVEGTVRLTAVAGYDMNGSRSNQLRQTFTVPSRCKMPEIRISDDGLVTIEASDPVFYTLDGSCPYDMEHRYTEPFRIEPGTVVRALAFEPGGAAGGSYIVTRCFTARHNLFDDVFPEDWYYDAMDYAASEGILKGTGDYSMSPNDTLTRAMLVTILYRVNGEPKTASIAAFPDVAEGEWYTESVAWAQENGIVNGFPDGTFRPDDPITREQLTTIFHRYHRFTGFYDGCSETLASFKDGECVNSFARQSMAWAVEFGLVKGVDNDRLDPQGFASRAQTAAIIQRYLNNTEGLARYYRSDEELLKAANAILQILSDKDYKALSDALNSVKGISFTPYSSVDPEHDKTLRPEELETLFESGEILTWGSWDGSGEPIELSLDAYWDRFVWNADYHNADQIGVNRLCRTGNATENLTEQYPNCEYIDYEIDSLSGEEAGTDWTSLRLVFQKIDGVWYLVAIVHGEWTV